MIFLFYAYKYLYDKNQQNESMKSFTNVNLFTIFINYKLRNVTFEKLYHKLFFIFG